MKVPEKIQILEDATDGKDIYWIIAKHVAGIAPESTDLELLTRRSHKVISQTIAQRQLNTFYRFHAAMRKALGDPDADLISYQGTCGTCYASWTPAAYSATGKTRCAVLPRKVDGMGYVQKEVIWLPDSTAVTGEAI